MFLFPETLEKNKANLQCELEIILVNDSPDETVEVSGCGALDVKVVNLNITDSQRAYMAGLDLTLSGLSTKMLRE